jgi:hypothetical protein
MAWVAFDRGIKSIGEDGLPAGGGSSFRAFGRLDDARQLFERLVAVRNDLGLLSEEYGPSAKRLVGNFPQAFSHIALINSAYNLDHARKPAEQHSGVNHHSDPRKTPRPSLLHSSRRPPLRGKRPWNRCSSRSHQGATTFPTAWRCARVPANPEACHLLSMPATTSKGPRRLSSRPNDDHSFVSPDEMIRGQQSKGTRVFRPAKCACREDDRRN